MLHPLSLARELFTEDQWDEVQDFDCGEAAYQKEVSDWLKGPFGADSALTSISNTEKPATVWLYRLPDGELVGFGALGKSRWRWKGKKDPFIPISVIIWYAVHKKFQKKPEGPREGHYSYQILEDLIAAALEEQDTHPVLGLAVHKDNERAIRLYLNIGFTEELSPFTQDGVEYQRMAVVLNAEALGQLWEEAKKKK